MSKGIVELTNLRKCIGLYVFGYIEYWIEVDSDQFLYIGIDSNCILFSLDTIYKTPLLDTISISPLFLPLNLIHISRVFDNQCFRHWL